MFIVKPIDEVHAIIKDTLKNIHLKTKTIITKDALHYVSAKDVYSSEDVPHFHRSIVDGYAVDFESVKFASASSPVILTLTGEVEMGKPAPHRVTPATTLAIPTGGHLPDGANSVVMIENTESINDDVFIYKSVSMWQNTLQKGSDIKANQLLLKKHTKITPLIIGALKSVGVNTIEVYEKLFVSVISTGDELVDDKEHIEIGEIRDINTYTIRNYLTNRGIIVTNTSIIRDSIKDYKRAILEGFQNNDIVISSGASSVGDKDYTIDVLHELGATILVHGMNIKPGKPTILALLHDKLFVGLPGQPTSAYIVLQTLFPVIERALLNLSSFDITPAISATLTSNVHSPSGRRLYQIVSLHKEGDTVYATPLFAKSGMINALKDADGYFILSEHSEGIDQGETVTVYTLGA